MLPSAGLGLLGSCNTLFIPPPNLLLQSIPHAPERSPASIHPTAFIHPPTSIHTTVTVQSSCSACCCCSWLPKLELPSQSSEQLNPGSIAHPQPSSSRTFALLEG